MHRSLLSAVLSLSLMRKGYVMRKYRAILLALCATLYTVYGWAQPQYAITAVDIYVEQTGQSLGPDGGIVGFVSVTPGLPLFNDPKRPALWRDGNTTMLPINGVARARNIMGTNVGIAYSPSAPIAQPMEWDSTGQVFFWDVPPGSLGQANAINDAGLATCTYSAGITLTTARCSRAGFELLPGLGGVQTIASVINNHGLAAGTAGTPAGANHVVAWDETGAIVDYGALGTTAYLYGLNDAGQLAGLTFVEGTLQTRAFGGALSTGLQPLQHPEGFESSAAMGLNNHGVRVGYVTRTTFGPSGAIVSERAMLWSSQDMAPIDLNNRIDPAGGWELRRAIGINDAGEILASASHPSRGSSIVLLRPITQPPSLAMRLNQDAFRPRETLRMTLQLRNPGPILTVDHYVGVIFPDGQTVLWLTNTSPIEGVVTRLDSNPNTFVPMLQPISWPAGLDATQQDYLTHTFAGLESLGVYHLLVAWTEPRSLEDGRIDEGDIIALDWKAIHVQ
jgi:hypothetical protein